MAQTQRLRVIGALLVGLGVVAAIVGVIGLLETSWAIDPFRYREVRYLPGFRSGSTIHLVTDGGEIYRLPERLWPDASDGPTLVRRLQRERTARVQVVGGRQQFWFGYPTITHFATPTLTLTAPPESPLRRMAPLIAAPLFAGTGLVLLRRLRSAG